MSASDFAEHIWVLDRSKSVVDQLEGSLGLTYRIKTFPDLNALKKAIERATDAACSPPFLIIHSESPPMIFEFLKKRDLSLRFMVVSECNDLGTICSCLELGASDYLLHPPDRNLMAAKVLYHLRRGGNEDGCGLIFDAFSLFVRNSSGVSIKLTPKEFQLLSMIEQAYPNAIGREELRAHVWGELKVVTKTLDVHLFKLRKKIEILGFEIVYRQDRYGIERSLPSR